MNPLPPQEFQGLAQALAEPTVIDSVDSTNLELLRRLSSRSARPGDVLVARSQTHGRGRHGRRWSAKADQGLLMSVALSLRGGAAVLATALGAVAVHGMLRDRGLPAVIDWPNDVLVGDAKIAGVLCEGRSDLAATVLGIGLNVAQSEGDFPTDLRRPATSLRALGREEPILLVAASLCRRLEELGRTVASRGPDLLAKQLLDGTGLRDRSVEVGRPGAVRTGRLVDLDAQFRLVLEVQGGRRESLPGAHVEFVRPAPVGAPESGTAGA